MATIEIIFPSDGQPGKITKWRVRTNTMVSAGRVLFLYNNVTPEGKDVKGPEKKFRATRFGRVKKLLVKEGEIIQPGQVIVTLEGCTHPTVMKDLCAECGADLRVEGTGNDGENTAVSQASVPMVHSVPELKVCPELAEKIGKEDEQRLLRDKKLALLVDLDQTIVHTTNDNIPPNMKDVYHYQLYGPNSPWYHTRLRPNTRHFLAEMSKLYELHICTFGARNYAHTVASLLDKDGTLFSHRILSRDECFDPASKTANLKALFPCGDDLVCIIDDREDVWQGCGNLVQVKPYHFFRHTGDIHAPPGLDKIDVPSPESTSVSEPNNMPEMDNNNGTTESGQEVATGDTKPEAANKTEETTEETTEDVTEEYREEAKEEMKEEPTEENKDKEDEKGMEIREETVIETDGNSDDTGKKTEDNKENEKSQDTQQAVEMDGQQLVEMEKKVKEEGLKTDNCIDEDDDDYLLYLEDILRRIHTEFYANIETEQEKRSLRDIIPRVREQVLKGLCLTFSGLIPTHQKLHQSRAYKVARAFGAEVTQDLTEKTTHLVAIKPGTAKANAAKKNGNIKIVNPDWLWTCAERWEHVDERLFPLTLKARASRIPPPHCSSPERMEEQNRPDKFADTINPLMSFTQEEIEIMDKEVDEDMEDQETDNPVFDVEDTEDGMEENSRRTRCRSSESEDSMNEDDVYESPRKRKKVSESSEESTEERDNDDDEDDPVSRFRRGEDLPDDLDLGDNSQDSVEDLEAVENDDDREWNAMGAALEREFLSE